MSDYEQTREADWVGSHYKVVVKRSSDKELPVLQLDENTKYYDNRISVKVLRMMVLNSLAVLSQRKISHPILTNIHRTWVLCLVLCM